MEKFKDNNNKLDSPHSTKNMLSFIVSLITNAAISLWKPNGNCCDARSEHAETCYSTQVNIRRKGELQAFDWMG